MKEIKMTQTQIECEIDYEAQCKCNDLLQQLLILNDTKVEHTVWDQIDEKGESVGWVIRDKHGKDLHL